VADAEGGFAECWPNACEIIVPYRMQRDGCWNPLPPEALYQAIELSGPKEPKIEL
jgi:hypothetical protein